MIAITCISEHQRILVVNGFPLFHVEPQVTRPRSRLNARPVVTLTRQIGQTGWTTGRERGTLCGDELRRPIQSRTRRARVVPTPSSRTPGDCSPRGQRL